MMPGLQGLERNKSPGLYSRIYSQNIVMMMKEYANYLIISEISDQLCIPLFGSRVLWSIILVITTTMHNVLHMSITYVYIYFFAQEQRSLWVEQVNRTL